MNFTLILEGIAVLGAMGAIFGALLAFAAKIFYVEVDPKQEAVRECLAGANCGGCGYPGCDGYKTGSTNEARYCISATAKKDGMRLIAVVLGTPAGQTRFDEARAMLEYGFANVKLTTPIAQGQPLDMTVPVRLGGRDRVSVVSGGTCSLLERRGEKNALSLEAALVERVNAPVYAGDVLGEIRVRRDGEVVAVVPAVAGEDVQLPGMVDALIRIRDHFMLTGA